MKDYYFEDLAPKYSLAKIDKIETEIMQLEKHLRIRKDILQIQETRSESIKHWDNSYPEERANFGKSQDEIENGDNAKSRAVISFAGVAQHKFEDLPIFWQASWLIGTTAFIKKSLDVPQEAGTKVNMEDIE